MPMTNSIISSSNDRKRLLTILKDFLRGDCSLSTLQQELHEYLTINFDEAPHRREIHDNRLVGEMGIPVKDGHVRHMIQKYVAGNISALELSNWAAFIFTSGLYVPEGETDEERWAAGDKPLWDILQQLMTPSLFGGLDPVVAQHYLEVLE